MTKRFGSNIFKELPKCIPKYVNAEDTNPADRYNTYPTGCKIGNGAGIMFAFAFVFLLFGLYDFRSKAVFYSVFCESGPVHVQ
ncbi:hypothetical protein EON65_20570 [archaeon]|nr:MAG: hypothetical protein EON65_20570 [archaeon]